MLNRLDPQIRETTDDLHLDVRIVLHDLNLPRQPDALVVSSLLMGEAAKVTVDKASSSIAASIAITLILFIICITSRLFSVPSFIY